MMRGTPGNTPMNDTDENEAIGELGIQDVAIQDEDIQEDAIKTGDNEDPDSSDNMEDEENEDINSNLAPLLNADGDEVRLLKSAVCIVMKSTRDIQALLDMVHITIFFSWYCK